MFGKLLTVSYVSRPDLCFDGKILSCKYGKATKADMNAVYRKIQKLKLENVTKMKYPDLGDILVKMQALKPCPTNKRV